MQIFTGVCFTSQIASKNSHSPHDLTYFCVYASKKTKWKTDTENIWKRRARQSMKNRNINAEKGLRSGSGKQQIQHFAHFCENSLVRVRPLSAWLSRTFSSPLNTTVFGARLHVCRNVFWLRPHPYYNIISNALSSTHGNCLFCFR